MPSVLIPSAASGGAASYYVSPSGSDSNDGATPERPLRTIQKAVDVAQAGSTVRLASGTYLQDFRSARNGSFFAPITITGPRTAVVKGAGRTSIVTINLGGGGVVWELADISSAIKADQSYDVRIVRRREGDGVPQRDPDGHGERPACGGGRVGFGTRNDDARFDDLRLA